MSLYEHVSYHSIIRRKNKSISCYSITDDRKDINDNVVSSIKIGLGILDGDNFHHAIAIINNDEKYLGIFKTQKLAGHAVKNEHLAIKQIK